MQKAKAIMHAGELKLVFLLTDNFDIIAETETIDGVQFLWARRVI